MRMTLHASNLCPTTTNRDLTQLFSLHGTVLSASVMEHLKSRNGSLSGLIEMELCDDGHGVIAALNGSEYRHRRLLLAFATPRQEHAADGVPMFESMNVPDMAENISAAATVADFRPR